MRALLAIAVMAGCGAPPKQQVSTPAEPVEYADVAEFGIDPATLRRKPLPQAPHAGGEAKADPFRSRRVQALVLENVVTGRRFSVAFEYDMAKKRPRYRGRVPCGRYRFYYGSTPGLGDHDLPCNDGNMTDLEKYFDKLHEKFDRVLRERCQTLDHGAYQGVDCVFGK